MPVNKSSTHPGSDDELPDFSTAEWQAKFAKAPVRRGRPNPTSRKSVPRSVSIPMFLPPSAPAGLGGKPASTTHSEEQRGFPEEANSLPLPPVTWPLPPRHERENRIDPPRGIHKVPHLLGFRRVPKYGALSEEKAAQDAAAFEVHYTLPICRCFCVRYAANDAQAPNMKRASSKPTLAESLKTKA